MFPSPVFIQFVDYELNPVQTQSISLTASYSFLLPPKNAQLVQPHMSLNTSEQVCTHQPSDILRYDRRLTAKVTSRKTLTLLT